MSGKKDLIVNLEMEYSYQYSKSIDLTQLQLLYTDADWTSYTVDMVKLYVAIQNSLDVISIWKSAQLIGLIRTVGDGKTIIYIQDLLILKSFQRLGHGSKLMQLILDKYKGVRQIILSTDDTIESRKFYESLGFESLDQRSVISFGKKY